MLDDERVYFLKYNATAQHKSILQSELYGLTLLNENHISVPKIEGSFFGDTFSFLILEWLDQVSFKDSSELLAEQLVKLHSIHSGTFGNVPNNFIGSLPQTNTSTDSFTEFYMECRLRPQLRLARDVGFDISLSFESSIVKRLDNFPKEPPTFIHGDLWGGNYLVSKSGAYLIDPSISFSNREMDIAMMHLFGGFDNEILTIYDKLLPLKRAWLDRMQMFQLYYLLVHLNLFGRSYYPQVLSILNKYK